MDGQPRQRGQPSAASRIAAGLICNDELDMRDMARVRHEALRLGLLVHAAHGSRSPISSPDDLGIEEGGRPCEDRYQESEGPERQSWNDLRHIRKLHERDKDPDQKHLHHAPRSEGFDEPEGDGRARRAKTEMHRPET